MAAPARRPASLDIAALAFSLMGFVGLIAIVWVLKNGAVGVPRILFLTFLAMVCAPFYVALFRTPKLPYLIPPMIAIFLQYPIGAPFGIVYSTDPIFNSSFTTNVIQTGFWTPGSGNAFAKVYTYYPLGNVFEAYLIADAGLVPMVAYNWIQPIIRVLAMPAIVFAIGRRFFPPRTAVLGLFLYLGTASILFNAPAQQEMGVIFVALSLLSLIILTQTGDRVAKRRSEVLFALVATGVVLTHHLSSYVFAAWLVSLIVLIAGKRFRPAGSGVRVTLLVFFFLDVLALYVSAFTYRIFFTHEQTFERVITQFLVPEELSSTPGAAGTGLGRTFTTLEIAWLAASVFVLLFLGLATIRALLRTRQHPFLAANGVVAAVLVLSTLPLIVTSLNYVPLRVSEYANLFLAPLAASTLLRWTRSGGPLRLVSPARRLLQERRWLAPTAAVFLSAALFMGGSLAPLFNMRVYFEAPNSRTTDSPIFFGSDVLRAAEWSRVHFGHARLWGDQLAVDAFAGFGDLEVDYGSSRFFVGDTIDPSLWCAPAQAAADCGAHLAEGDYVAVDSLMLVLRPNFFQEPARTMPLTQAQVEKFAVDRHFDLVYQDGTFSVYRVISVPPAAP